MENNSNNHGNRNTDNKRKVFWSITTVLLIIIIVVGGLLIFLLFNNKNKQVNDSSNNVSQDTLLFKQTDIVPFKDKIEANKWTTDEFKPNYQSLGLKTFTQNNFTVDGNSIRQLIDQVYPLSNTKIQINLSEFANIKYLISTDVDRELSYLVQNLLYIDGIDANFITGIRLTKLNAIYSAINNYINDSTRKYTFSEFQKDVNDNNEWFKTYVSDYLYISDVEKINPQHIKKVGFDANNNFTIELENEEVKYYIDVVDKNDDVTLNGNILTIENLKYYDVEIIDETNLNQLKDNVQSFIEANQISASQFLFEIDKNTFKSAIANYLNIKTTSIGNATFNNSLLKISPASRIKFRVKTNNDTTSNLIDSNGDIRVANLTFFNSITLYNLDKLYIAINNYINESNNQFTPEEFRDDFKNPTSLTRIRNEVFDNLYTSSSSTLAKDKVIDISLDKLNRLAITLDTDYTKYDISGQYNNVYFDNDGTTNNSKLVIDNLQYWKNITVSDANLNNLQTRIQSYINTKGYTKEAFTNDVSKTAFKSEIMNYLNITDANSISRINFENDVLQIVPAERNKFISPLNSNLIVNNNIQVSGFNFFTVSNITNLDKLWEATNNYITEPTRKLTSDEFRVKLVDDKDYITTTLANNIDIVLNNTRAIDKTKITNLVLNSNNELEISLDPNSVKYQLSSTNLNVSLNGNKLIVKNLKFYNAVNITTDKLNSLQKNIQSYIDTKESTETSFVDETSSNDFRIAIINYLGVNNGDVINTISYNTRNKVLTITPTDNDRSRNKFTSTNNSNLIVNNNIEVSGFNFFNTTTLSNTDKLTDVVNTIITSEDNKFTADEFKKYITDNLETFKNTIANNIDISWNEKLNPNKIQNIQLN
ncbi:MAG: hypothetical protein K2I49_03240, partial [Ureaplasma sp.]|nr:hypothetical protein [Ureaplasma sp.]